MCSTAATRAGSRVAAPGPSPSSASRTSTSSSALSNRSGAGPACSTRSTTPGQRSRQHCSTWAAQRWIPASRTRPLGMSRCVSMCSGSMERRRRRWRALAGALRSDGRGRRTPADLVEELVEVVDAPSGGEVEQLDDDLCTRLGNRYGEGGHGQALGKRRHRREAALGKRAVASGTTEARRGEGRGCSTPLASCPSLRLPSARGYGRERNQGAMMNPFFRTPPPSDEEEKKERGPAPGWRWPCGRSSGCSPWCSLRRGPSRKPAEPLLTV